MRSYDVKTARRDLYAPGATDFQLVEVPRMAFLMIDGHGDPNTESAYGDAVRALYTASYAIRAVAGRELDRVHVVAPLEGLWSADDLGAFVRRDKSAWDWTMLIAQPDWITAAVVDEAMVVARRKNLPALDLLRFGHRDEGRCVQILHVGAYDDEGPTLARLHEEYLPAHGLAPTGPHHEIYLSDPRRTAPARLRTILRQPVAPATT